VLVVVMITMIVSVPMGFFYELVIWKFCVRRPKIQRWSWFSYSKSHSNLFDSQGVSPLSELYASIDDDRAVDDNKQMNNIQVSERKLNDVNRNTDRVLSSFYDSDEAESKQLLQRTRQLLHEYITSASPPWKDASSIARNSKLNQLDAIQTYLGFYSDGTAVPLNLWDKILYGDAVKKLESKVRAARSKANSIRYELLRLGKDEHFQRDVTLMDLFILEQFSLFKQFCLSKQMFQFSLVQALPIQASQWFFATAFIILSILFFLYWILQRGVTEGGHRLKLWGLNFGLSILQDVVFIQPVRVYLIYVVSMSSIKPQLISIYRVLSRVAMRCVLNEDRVDPTKLTVVQHLSPACRAAQFNIASDLAAARILRSVDDVDKDDCKKVQNRLSAVVYLVLLIPVLLGLFDKSISDIVFKSILTCVPTAALIVTYYFYHSIGLYFIIVYAVVVLIVIAVFWRKSMVMRQISAMMVTSTGQSVYWNAMDSSSLRVHPNYYLSMMHHAGMSFARYWYQTSIVDDSAEAWKLFNFPYHLHGVVVVSSKPEVIDENQELSSTINPPPVPLDLIPTEITNMTKGIL